MEELKVKNIIIGKQFESCENYEAFVKIVQEKKMKVNVVKVGQRVNIEKDLHFDVLWPNPNNRISENAINNNSLVCKFVYKDFSMLFVGDIEAVAEKAILKKYKNNLGFLKSDILKVAHHGSKTSSIIEFLQAVNPQYALIGVGKNNKFGHPNKEVLDRLEKLRC